MIDYSEFIEMERRYPMILFPAFRMQDAMQRTSLGTHSSLISFVFSYFA